MFPFENLVQIPLFFSASESFWVPLEDAVQAPHPPRPASAASVSHSTASHRAAQRPASSYLPNAPPAYTDLHAQVPSSQPQQQPPRVFEDISLGQPLHALDAQFSAPQPTAYASVNPQPPPRPPSSVSSLQFVPAPQLVAADDSWVQSLRAMDGLAFTSSAPSPVWLARRVVVEIFTKAAFCSSCRHERPRNPPRRACPSWVMRDYCF